MKSFCFLLFLAGTIHISTEAQNLVINPGFELFSSCPTKLGQLSRAKHWFSPNGGTPEYLNLECAMNGVTPLQGKGAAGVIFFGDYPRTVEYIGTKLSEPLVQGEEYELGFSLLVEESFMYIDKVGMLLTTDDISISEWRPFYELPQLLSPPDKPITPELGWLDIQENYTASGGEQYLTIGNFYRRDAHLVLLNEFASSYSPGWVTYFYVDNVRVIPKKDQEIETLPSDSLQIKSIQLFFDRDEFQLSTAGLDSLFSFLNELDASIISSFDLRAFTDSTGTVNYNQQLSQRRAIHVMNRLEEWSKKSIEIFTQCNGETSLGGFPNYFERRVELRVAQKQEKP